MSKKEDPEIIPPSKGRLPARRDEEQNLPSETTTGLWTPRGAISAFFTIFQNDMTEKAYNSLARVFRAQSDALQADSERRASALKLKQKGHELEELPEILATDRAEREKERAQQAFEREEAAKDREAEAEKRAAAREREKWEAKDAANRAKHGHHTTLENRAAIRKAEAERWRAEAEAKRDEQRVKAAEWRAALKEDAKEEAETVEEVSALDQQIAALHGELEQRLADGKDTTTHREAISALERLKVAK